MSRLFKIVNWLPLHRETKTAWKRELLDRAYAKDIAEARKVKDSAKVESLDRDRRFELDIYDEEDDSYVTQKLTSEARRLRVPIPHRHNDDGSQSEFWEEGQYVTRMYLSRKGIAILREEIRKERKARHEGKSYWIAWLSAITGIVGAITGLVAVWFKNGRLRRT